MQMLAALITHAISSCRTKKHGVGRRKLFARNSSALKFALNEELVRKELLKTSPSNNSRARRFSYARALGVNKPDVEAVLTYMPIPWPSRSSVGTCPRKMPLRPACAAILKAEGAKESALSARDEFKGVPTVFHSLAHAVEWAAVYLGLLRLESNTNMLDRACHEAVRDTGCAAGEVELTA